MNKHLGKRKAVDDLKAEPSLPQDDWDWSKPNTFCGPAVAFRNNQVDVLTLAAWIHNKNRDSMFRQAVGKQFWKMETEPWVYHGFVEMKDALEVVEKAVDKTRFREGFHEKLQKFEASEDWKSIQEAPAKRQLKKEAERLQDLKDKDDDYHEEVTKLFKKARKSLEEWRLFRGSVQCNTIADRCICGGNHAFSMECVKTYFD